MTLLPAEHASWQDARADLMTEAKAGLKAKLEAEISSCTNDDELEELKARFSQDERALEHKARSPSRLANPRPFPLLTYARPRRSDRPRGPHLLGDHQRAVQLLEQRQEVDAEIAWAPL